MINSNLHEIKKCFVCHQDFPLSEIKFNKTVNLPVCKKCSGTKEEEVAVQEALDSLGDGFVCGCI